MGHSSCTCTPWKHQTFVPSIRLWSKYVCTYFGSTVQFVNIWVFPYWNGSRSVYLVANFSVCHPLHSPLAHRKRRLLQVMAVDIFLFDGQWPKESKFRRSKLKCAMYRSRSRPPTVERDHQGSVMQTNPNLATPRQFTFNRVRCTKFAYPVKSTLEPNLGQTLWGYHSRIIPGSRPVVLVCNKIRNYPNLR